MAAEVLIPAILKKNVSIQQLFDKKISQVEFTITGEYDEKAKKFLPQSMSAICTSNAGTISDEEIELKINDELQKSIVCTHDFKEIADEIVGYSTDKEPIHEKTKECSICGLNIIVTEPKKNVRYTPVTFAFGGIVNKESFFDAEEYRYVSSI